MDFFAVFCYDMFKNDPELIWRIAAICVRFRFDVKLMFDFYYIKFNDPVANQMCFILPIN